jgi:aerobic carbon-monoxide dehydrogenase medium subunit
VKPAPFAYECPSSVDEAVALLASHSGEAKILAGGQSLVPLLNFRMLRPSLLVDVNRLSELDFLEERDDGLRVGALTRHHRLETSHLVRRRLPVLAEAMAHVAHPAIRNRGTIGGSLAHADPAAELPLIAVLLDAEIHTRCAAGGRRHRAADFFLGPLTTLLGEDEIVTEIVFPGPPPRTGGSFEEVSLRHGDFAIAASAATVTASGGTIAAVRLAVTGVDAVPRRLAEVEAGLAGQKFSPDLIEAAARQARDSVSPGADLRASADYRRHLVAVLAERVLTRAWARAA